ncbi:MAG: hypothetical protein HY897_18970 [Deltaproteobacteria bacterium]|nr:hypothetical protein [Deltaproteobacteria bacterium]
MGRDRFTHLEPTTPDANSPSPAPAAGEAGGQHSPAFARTLEADGDLMLDHSDKSVPYHVCRTCGMDNPLGVAACQNCQGPIGGASQREHDIETYQQRIASSHSIEKTDIESCANPGAKAARALSEAKQAEDTARAQEHQTRIGVAKARVWFSIAAAALAVLIVPVLLLSRRNPTWGTVFFALLTAIGILFFINLSLRTTDQPPGPKRKEH